MSKRSKTSIDASQNIFSDIPTTPQYCTSQNHKPTFQFTSGLQKCMSQSQPGLQDYSIMSDCSQSQTGFMRQSQTCSMPQSRTHLQDYSTVSLNRFT